MSRERSTKFSAKSKLILMNCVSSFVCAVAIAYKKSKKIMREYGKFHVYM